MIESPDWVQSLIGSILFIILVVVAGYIWWFFPKNRAAEFKDDPKARADVEDNFRKTISQVYAGVAVLIGAWLAYQGTQETLSVNREQATDLLVSNEASKSYELLGSDKRDTRLGGIYGLEAVMQRSTQYRGAVISTLASFVRNHYKDRESWDDDAVAALSVIARRQFRGSAYLRGVDFQGMSMPGANLSEAVLDYTCLARTDLRGVDLRRASLRHADFNGPNSADLSDADLGEADLSEANLSKARLSKARGLTQMQLDGACGIGAELPLGLTLKLCPSDWSPVCKSEAR